MTSDELHIHEAGPLAHVSFKRSSTKDAGLGYDIDVYAGCTNEEADTTFAIALRLKEKADEALRPRPLTEKENELIEAIKSL